MAAEAEPARLARARALLKVDRAEAARGEVAALLADEPHNAEALCLLAQTFRAEDDYAAMRDAARRAVEADPGHRNGHVQLAFAFLGLHDWAATRAAALEAIRLGPEDWRAFLALAAAELGQGHPRRALRTAAHAVRLAPHEPETHFGRGLLFHSIGFKHRARRLYRQTLALDPNHTGALTRLGRLAVDRARLSEAAGHIGAVLSAAPTDHGARTQLDRLILLGLGGRTIMVVWTAGLLGLFTMFPWMWAAVLLLPAAWCVRAARTWRSLSPGLRAYARQMPRSDARARVRVAALVVCALTAAGLTVGGSLQDPGGDAPAWLLILIGAHLLSLFATAVAIVVVDRRAARPRIKPRRDSAPAPAGMLAEPREAAPAGRSARRAFVDAGVLALLLWLLSIDPPPAWPVQAAVVLAVLGGYGWWERRRP
jgi:tetratricopeptide (TPR) repeat protein